MKTLLIAAAALSVLGATAASAQPGYDHRGHDRSGERHGRSDRHDNRGGRFDRHRNIHRYSRGERLPRNYWSQQYVVSDWRARHLRAPPRGYQWRRVNNDYVLAAVTTGLIASIIAGR